MRSASTCWLTVAVAVALGAAAFPGVAAASSAGDRQAVLRSVAKYRAVTWRWQRLMGQPLTPSTRAAERTTSPAFRRWVLDFWMKRAARARRQVSSPPHRSAWLCIHRYEGPWDDPGAPYYGGLQMDLAFQRANGPELLRRKGTANNWTPLEQMWVAERALRRGSGFYPWPNAARRCGLI